MYSRLTTTTFFKKEESTLFTIEELKKWIQRNQKWTFIDQKHLPTPYYIPSKISDSTLVFESRFECGNLLLAVKVSDSEYKLMLQNDSLTNRNTQC